MKISSEHIMNLLAYSRERHGAPCRVELRSWWKGHTLVRIYYRDIPSPETAILFEHIEEILI